MFSSRKNLRFYKEIAPKLNSLLIAAGMAPLRMPSFYFGNLEEEKETILLEDLRPRGFKLVESRKVLDAEHTTLVLQELGRFHAASVLLQAETPEDDLADIHSFLSLDFTNYYENAAETFFGFCKSS